MKPTLGILLSALALPCLAASGPSSVVAVHTFSASQAAAPADVNGDGANPQARMYLGSDGNLYGTTTAGGANGAGNIFTLSPNYTLTDLYDFQPFLQSDGTEFGDFGPNELIEGAKGLYYGTTQRGGTNGDGTIFKTSPSGGEADLYAFSPQGTNLDRANLDGFYPSASLVLGSDGNFYGTTQYGGANGTGTIFQVTPSGTLTTLYSFGAADGNLDGITPNSLTLGADSNFYGTTQLGGPNDAGTFFQFTMSGVLTPLYSFGSTGSDPAQPQAALVLGPDGNFYGTSATGGAESAGAIFRATATGTVRVLYSFTGGNDGGYISAPLALGTDGNFYGVTDAGVHGTGTIFKVTPAGAFSTVYSFPAFTAAGAGTANSTGAFPSAGLVMGRDGSLYGSCYLGGTSGNGTLFRYTNSAFSSPYQPPTITTQPPAKETGLAGTYLTLTAGVKGAPPFTWQWVKNRTTLLTDAGDIAGSATGSLVVGPLQAADAGSYAVTVTNNFGTATSATAVLTVLADSTPPTIKIVSPLAGARTNSPVFSGTASDNARVTNVLWWITNFNGGTVLNGAATLTRAGSNWTISVTPFPGTNILAVQSVDSSGRTSKPATQTFFDIATNSIGVFAGGDGSGSFGGGASSVKNDTVPANGALLHVGEGYTITAVPAAGSLFSNWVGLSDAGAFAGNTAKLSFIMESNLVLTANFTTNFFLGAHGVYNGLFYNTNAVAAESSGMLQTLALGTNGAFTAKLLKPGTTYSFSGTFNVAGNYATNLGPASAAGGPLKLNMAIDRDAQVITGTVSNTLWSAGLLAERAGSNLPSSEYTFLFVPPGGALVGIPPSGGPPMEPAGKTGAVANAAADQLAGQSANPSGFPPGYGYAAATNHLGLFTLSGKLADGAAIAPAVAASQTGDLPLYSGSLYGNTGLLIGWINLASVQTSQTTNTLAWIKKASRSYPPYTNGFTNLVTVQGALWTNPPARIPAISLPEGPLTIASSVLSLPFTVAVSNNNAIVKVSGNITTNSLTGSITPKTGVFTVTFGNGNGRATTPGVGILLQPSASGGGYFLGTTNAGSITLSPVYVVPADAKAN